MRRKKTDASNPHEEPAPGRFSRDTRAPKFDAISSQALADRLMLIKFRLKKKFSYVAFAKAAGVSFKRHGSEPKGFNSRLSRWLNRAGTSPSLLGEENYRRLVAHLLAQPEYASFADAIDVPALWLLRRPLYHALSRRLHCRENIDTLEHMHARVVGSYRIFRPSILKYNYGFIGRLEIFYDSSSDAFCTHETYKNNGLSWDIDGALYPISRDLFMTISVDPHDLTIQTKYFNEVSKRSGGLSSNPEQIMNFSGVVSDLEGTRYYTTRLYAESINRNDVVDFNYTRVDEFPEHVRRYLDQEFHGSKSSYIIHE